MDTTKDSFVLEAGPNTDIWRKPPTTNVWSGAYELLYPKLSNLRGH